MSSGRLDLVREAFAAFNRRDKANFDELTDTGLVMCPVREWPEAQPVEGRDAVWDFLLENEVVWDSDGYELTEVEEIDQSVLICSEQRASGRTSGAALTVRFYGVIRVGDERVGRMEFFLDRNDAVEAARVSP